MTISDLSVNLCFLFGTVSFLITLLYLFVLIKSVFSKVKLSVIVTGVLLLSVSCYIFLHLNVMLMERKISAEYYITHPWFLSLPAVSLVIVLLLLVLICAVLIIKIKHYIEMSLTPSSLQEGLDRMTDGICFSTTDGVPLLVNQRMQDICIQAFDESLFDVENIKHRFVTRRFQPGCEVVKKGANSFLKLADGSVWNIVESNLKVSGSYVKEFVAYDVTRQYNINKELEVRNTHLAEVNRQLREYNKNLDAIIRDREILAAKIKLHDDVGRSLLALRSYLTQGKGNREELVSLWRFTVSLLKREAVSPENESRIEALVKAAASVDVQLIFNGEIPKGEKQEEVIALALHECLTNTVKHAGGTELRIKTFYKNNYCSVEITNNGVQPNAVIKETGGLKNLRTTVENAGYEMRIESIPVFKLILNLNSKEEGRRNVQSDDR